MLKQYATKNSIPVERLAPTAVASASNRQKNELFGFNNFQKWLCSTSWRKD